MTAGVGFSPAGVMPTGGDRDAQRRIAGSVAGGPSQDPDGKRGTVKARSPMSRCDRNRDGLVPRNRQLISFEIAAAAEGQGDCKLYKAFGPGLQFFPRINEWHGPLRPQLLENAGAGGAF